MRIEILSRGERKKIDKELNVQFGICKLNFLLIQSGKKRIKGYSGSLSKDEIKKLNQAVKIEGIGLYIARMEEEGLRLSVDAVGLLKDKITKSMLKINDEQAERWMKGENIDIAEELSGFFIVKNKEDFLGSGKASRGKLYNFIPKERRAR